MTANYESSNILNTRRPFWAYSSSSNNCLDVTIPIVDTEAGRILNTSGFLKSLVFNILFTNGEQPVSECGVKPSLRGGHWSTTFSKANVGTFFPAPDSQDVEALNTLYSRIIRTALQKLVTLNLVERVEVNSEVDTNNTISINILLYGFDQSYTNILLQHNKAVGGSWVWR